MGGNLPNNTVLEDDTFPSSHAGVWNFNEAKQSAEFSKEENVEYVNRLYKWSTNTCQLKQGLYSPIFKISIQDVDLLDSIVFYIGSGKRKEQLVLHSKLITHEKLKHHSQASGDPSTVYKLKLRRQIEICQEQSSCLEVRIQIRLCPGPASSIYPVVQSFELSQCTEKQPQDPLIYVHTPYQWSINVQSRPPNSEDPAQSIKIVRYSVSGNGKFVATLSATDKFIYLDLWEISQVIADNEASPKNVATDNKTLLNDMAADNAVLLSDVAADNVMPKVDTILVMPPAKAFLRKEFHYGGDPCGPDASISVSWNGDYVALIPTKKERWLKEMVLFDRKLEPSEAAKSCEDLDHPGEGRFMDGDGSNELFLFIGQVPEVKYSIGIYQVSKSWSYLYNLEYSVPIEYARLLADSIQGKYLSCFTGDGLRTIWDIRARSLVVVMPEGSKMEASLNLIAFSSNQAMIAILQDNTIKTYWTGSSSVIGKWSVPTSVCVSHLTFVRGDSQLLVQFTDSRSEEKEQAGYILGPFSPRFAILGKVLGSGSYVCKTPEAEETPKAKGTQKLYSCHNSKLDFIELDDITYDPDSVNSYKCDQQKCDPLPSNQEYTVDSANSIKSASEPKFSCVSHSGATTTFSLRDSAIPSQLLNIPVDILGDSDMPTVHFLSKKMLLILCYKYFVVIWKAQENGDFTLLRVHWTRGRTTQKPKKEIFARLVALFEQTLVQSKPGATVGQVDEGVEILDPYKLDKGKDIKICTCQRELRIPMLPDEEKKPADGATTQEKKCVYIKVPLTEIPDNSNGHGFIEGIRVVVQMYKVADGTYKKEVVRYLSQHINRYPNLGELLDCVVCKIAETWTADDHGVCKKLMTSVFDFKSSKWIPRPDYKSHNPLSVVLDKVDKELKHWTLADIIIQYCLRKAEEDRSFLSPITACLPRLWEKERRHHIALDSLRKMAYVPVKDGTYLKPRDESGGILETFVELFDDLLSISQKMLFAPIFRVLLWALLLIVIPIAFLRINAGSIGKIIGEAYFRHDSVICIDQPQNNIIFKGKSGRHIFVARFEMMWAHRDPKCSLGSTKNVDMTRDSIHMPLFMLYHSIVPCRRIIKRHELSLDAFDNPAIAALIAYKWKAFGFRFWLMRFLFQCIYYFLVLAAVLMQVYKGQEPIAPLYISIVVLATYFLWLELLQLMDGFGLYFSSPYNLFDLLAFALPLAGSISQLVEPNTNITVFSFSVIFIFLHLLFELRAIESLCNYTTIIIQVFAKLRVFFLIFTVGIVAFTIAILHMLHGCTVGECTESNSTAFPKGPIAALSATYFFMVGIYKPVEDVLDNGDWRFQLMLATYVLFTVILMLNVLIALINTAFNTGHETWRKVWLESQLNYIEAAEDISYNIPGFRVQHPHWFLNEVYFAATPDQVEAYKKNYGLDDSSRPIVEGGDISELTRKIEELQKNQFKMVEMMKMIQKSIDERKMKEE